MFMGMGTGINSTNFQSFYSRKVNPDIVQIADDSDIVQIADDTNESQNKPEAHIAKSSWGKNIVRQQTDASQGRNKTAVSCDNKEKPSQSIESQPHLGQKAKFSKLFRFKDAMKKIYDEYLALLIKQEKKPAVLIVGVANGEEPLSWLSLFHLNHDMKSVQLSTIDIQLRGEVNMQSSLGQINESFFIHPPKELRECFDCNKEEKQYQVKKEVVEHLENVFNSNNSKWGVSIVDSSSITEGQQYDLVTCNWVLTYINDEEDRKKALENLMASVKPGGVLMVDPSDGKVKINEKDREEILNSRLFQEVEFGVYLKVNSNEASQDIDVEILQRRYDLCPSNQFVRIATTILPSTGKLNSEQTPEFVSELAKRRDIEAITEIFIAYQNEPNFLELIKRIGGLTDTEIESIANKLNGPTDKVPNYEQEKLKVARGLEEYCDSFDIGKEQLKNKLDGKRILLIGGGASPLKKELEKMGCECHVTNIDINSYENPKLTADTTIVGNFLDHDFGEEQFDEVWALHSLPTYARNGDEVDNFYRKSIQLLIQQGTLRVSPYTGFVNRLSPQEMVRSIVINRRSERTIENLNQGQDIELVLGTKKQVGNVYKKVPYANIQRK